VAIRHRLTVSEASRALGLSRTTLLAAEEAGLLTAMRTPGGHRRYDPAEPRRYAERADAAGWSDAEAAHPAVAETKAGAGADAAETAAIGAALRLAVRPLARALDADSAGLYLLRAGAPHFTAAFGVPRWLSDRLAAGPPVAQALAARRPYLFDPTSASRSPCSAMAPASACCSSCAGVICSRARSGSSRRSATCSRCW
jgi:excisionase family DNA binding protein